MNELDGLFDDRVSILGVVPAQVLFRIKRDVWVCWVTVENIGCDGEISRTSKAVDEPELISLGGAS